MLKNFLEDQEVRYNDVIKRAKTTSHNEAMHSFLRTLPSLENRVEKYISKEAKVNITHFERLYLCQNHLVTFYKWSINFNGSEQKQNWKSMPKCNWY